PSTSSASTPRRPSRDRRASRCRSRARVSSVRSCSASAKDRGPWPTCAVTPSSLQSSRIRRVVTRSPAQQARAAGENGIVVLALAPGAVGLVGCLRKPDPEGVKLREESLGFGNPSGHLETLALDERLHGADELSLGNVPL